MYRLMFMSQAQKDSKKLTASGWNQSDDSSFDH
jgi:hypothetical protein